MRHLIIALLLSPLSAQGIALQEVHRPTPTHDSGSWSVTGDLNGDGRMDVLTLGSERFPVALLDDGPGRFRPLVGPRAVRGTARDVALADLDGDGDLDAYLAVDTTSCRLAQCSGGRDTILWNDGQGQLDPNLGPQPPVGDDLKSQAVALGDIDGDGDVDALIAVAPHYWSPCSQCPQNVERPENVLLRNDGSGVFTRLQQPITQAKKYTEEVALVDVDADGDLDAYVANNDLRANADDDLYLNDGAGNFTLAPGGIAGASLVAGELVPFDIDSDGDLDLLRLTNQAVDLMVNTGTGTWTAVAQPTLATIASSRQVLVGDWDGDNDDDLAVRVATGSVPEHQVLTILNTGGGNLVLDAGRTFPAWTGSIAAADFDLDGDRDLFLCATFIYQDELRYNDGSGQWIPAPVPFANDPANFTDHVLLDVDGDGDLDVAAAATESYENRIYRNDGWGGFTPVPGGAFIGDRDETTGLASGDVDGDGDADLVVSNALLTGPPHAARVYLNDGTGQFAGTNLPVTNAFDVELGDLDGDGDLDMVFVGLTGAQTLRNQGGTFQVWTGGTSGSASAVAVQLGDLDGDGDLDGMTASWYTNANQVLRNDGTGRLVADPTLPPLATSDSRDVALGDVDGDGDLDALIANGGSGIPQANALLINDGTGAFSAGPYPTDTARTVGVHLADLDRDGDLDALEVSFIATMPQTPTRVLAGDGNGVFTPLSGGLPAASPYAQDYETGDLDGDGDLDGFLIARGAPQLHVNVQRHLAWRYAPRVGANLTLDVFGPPNTPAFLAASLQTAHVPVPPFGTFGVDPSTLVALPAGTLDGAGRGSATLSVPANPSFAGLSVYWQAVVAPPLHLTNRETTTFQAL